MDTVNTVLDPAAISDSVYAKVFSQAGIDSLLIPSDDSAGFKFVDRITDNKHAQEMFRAFALAIMTTIAQSKDGRQAAQRISIATATAMWLGYQLAQAQMAELPAQHS
jgi:hypothetical protein